MYVKTNIRLEIKQILRPKITTFPCKGPSEKCYPIWAFHDTSCAALVSFIIFMTLGASKTSLKLCLHKNVFKLGDICV